MTHPKEDGFSITHREGEAQSQLLPCPFCGSHGEELGLFCDPAEGHDNSGPSRRIQCYGCHIEAPFYDTEAEAVAAWNRRPPMEAAAWREKALTTTQSGGGRPVTILFSQVSSFNMTNCNDDERRVVMRGGETYRLRKSDADTIIQALAVIPTEGLGSSATPIPTCDAEGLAANLMADLGVLAATAREVPFDVWDRFANNVMRAAEKLTASTPPEAGQ